MMSEFRDVYYQSSDGLQLYARDYHNPSPRGTVLCMHGLTRNSADFATLSATLAGDYRVISVDQRGRGLSDFDSDPTNYNPQVYVRDMFTLLDHLEIERVTAIGTSMGGVISMGMGATAGERFNGIVLNDIGPEIDPAGLDRIRSYVGKLPPVKSWDDAAAQVRETNKIAFPDYTDSDWMAFARNVYKDGPDGAPVITYDPAIATSISDDNPRLDLWPLFDALNSIPILVVRGSISDILAASCVKEMRRRREDLEAVEVPGRGHAPMLDEPAAMAGIRTFLDRISSG